MSFQNQISDQGISINVIPSFGRIVQIEQPSRNQIIHDVESWKRRQVLHEPPVGFNPARYASFSYVQRVQNPVSSDQIHEYVQRSRLIRRN